MADKNIGILHIALGDLAGNKEFEIKDVVSIGREKGNTVIIPNSNVSRKHARVSKNYDGKFEIEDLGSHNGTLLNGRLARKEILQDGDVINIADIKIIFNLVGDEKELSDIKKIDHLDSKTLNQNSTEFIDLTELDKDEMDKLREDKPSITNHWKD